MNTKTSDTASNIEIGRFSYSHNRFLLMLAGFVGLAYGAADYIATWFAVPREGLWKLAAPQMIWALIVLAIASFAFRAFKRAGHGDTARSCLMVAGGFVAGAVIRTFLL